MPLKSEITYHDFNRRYAVLNTENYPLFHKILHDFGRADLSWRINRCGIDSTRLDCDNDIRHIYYVPAMCNKRICPNDADKQMSLRIKQFLPIADIAEFCEYEESQYPNDSRVRFWTFTVTAEPYKPLRPVFIAMKKAIHRWWRYTHGERSELVGGPYDYAGGLFCLEVGAGWNVHYHALILGPYFGKEKDSSKFKLSQVKEIWYESIEKAGYYSNRLDVRPLRPDPLSKRKIYKGSVYETIAYPLKPDKQGKFGQELLANITVGIDGRRRKELTQFNRNYFPAEQIEIDETGREFLKPIKRIPRYILKGLWYNNNKFHLEKRKAICSLCIKDSEFSNLSWDYGLDEIYGKRFKKNFFSYNEKGLDNFKNYAYQYPSKEEIEIAEAKSFYNKIPKNGQII